MAFMFEKMRNTAAEIQSSTVGHGDLSMAVYYNNLVIESMDKLIFNQSKVYKSLHLWSQRQSNKVITSLMQTFDEINSIWVNMMQDYVKQFTEHKNTLNLIISSVKMLEEKKKEVTGIENKVNKLKKQLDSTGKNDDLIKTEELYTELGKMMSLEEYKKQEMTSFEEIHEIQKFHQLVNGAEKRLEAATKFHKQSASITEAQSSICVTCKKLGHEADQEHSRIFHEYSTSIVSELKKSLTSNIKVSPNINITNQERNDTNIKNTNTTLPIITESSPPTADELNTNLAPNMKNNSGMNIQHQETKDRIQENVNEILSNVSENESQFINDIGSELNTEEENRDIDAQQYERFRSISFEEPLKEYNILTNDTYEDSAFIDKDDLILELNLSDEFNFEIDSVPETAIYNKKTLTDGNTCYQQRTRTSRGHSILSVSSIQDEYIDDELISFD